MIENVATRTSPGRTKVSPSPVTSAFVGAVMASEELNLSGPQLLDYLRARARSAWASAPGAPGGTGFEP